MVSYYRWTRNKPQRCTYNTLLWSLADKCFRSLVFLWIFYGKSKKNCDETMNDITKQQLGHFQKTYRWYCMCFEKKGWGEWMNVSKSHDEIKESVIHTIGWKSNVDKKTNQFELLTKQDTEKSRQISFNFERTVRIILSKW